MNDKPSYFLLGLCEVPNCGSARVAPDGYSRAKPCIQQVFWVQTLMTC
jgi:hypothetical protein